MEQTTCPTPHCPRPPRHKGWCPKPKKSCSIDNCDRDAAAMDQDGWCKNHRRRWRTTGDTGVAQIRGYAPGVACSVKGCESETAALGLCPKHYARFRKHGDPLKALTRERPDYRTCAKCLRTPDEVEFKKDKRAPDGLGAYCKPCEKQYNAAHYAANRTERNRENSARYYANRERYLARQRAYRLDNIAAIHAKDRARSRGNPRNIERSRRWRTENRERFLALMRQWYRENTERARESSRRWVANNPERVRQFAADSAARRSAQKRNAAGKVEWINRRTIWRRDRGICGLCAQPVPFRDMHLDHKIPLSRGGEHTMSNVHATHSRCNLSKGNREVPQWGFATITLPAPRRPLPEGAMTLF